MHTLLRSILLLLVLLPEAYSAEPVFRLPPNHQSQYRIEKFATHVGDINYQLNYQNNVIRYSSVATAKGLAAFFISSKPEESSILNWPENAPQSLPRQQSFDYIQEKQHKKNQHITFNYTQANEVQIDGSYKNRQYNLQSAQPVWSRQLIPLLMSSDLLLRPETTHNSFYITDKGKIQKYTYTLQTTENIKFENKPHSTLKFKITKEGSQRISYAWLSADYFYLPLKIEQYKGADLTVRMYLTYLKLD